MRRIFSIFLQTTGAVALVAAAFVFLAALFAGYWMRVDDPPIPADYILPLAGDGHRMMKAAELHRKGYASTILLSNAVKTPPSPLKRLRWKIGYPRYSREQYLSLILPILGAETARLEEFGDGHVSTVEEAEALKRHLKGKPVRLLIVTSPYHAKRAQMIFKDVLPDSAITVVSTTEDGFPRDWWKDQRAAQNLIMEFAKTIHYLLGGAFRSTDSASG